MRYKQHVVNVSLKCIQNLVAKYLGKSLQIKSALLAESQAHFFGCNCQHVLYSFNKTN